ncbi:MAG: hypothetical protein ACOVNV_03975 [Pirellulaceae bacterium]
MNEATGPSPPPSGWSRQRIMQQAVGSWSCPRFLKMPAEKGLDPTAVLRQNTQFGMQADSILAIVAFFSVPL